MRTAVHLAATLMAGATLAGCSNSDTFDRSTQLGASPVLPAPNEYLLPPMHVAKAVGWTGGAHDQAAGHRVQASAPDLRSAQWRRAGG